MSEPETVRPPGEGPASAPARPPRFSWPMRIFLGFILFDMIFRSFSVLYPWNTWAGELEMRKLPERFATIEERKRLAEEAKAGQPDPVSKDTRVALASLRDFLNPWPTPQTRKHLKGPTEWSMYALTWLASRLGLFENVVGFNNEWPMFSPNVGRGKSLARARLFYEDGSERVQRTHGDPVDLNAYAHWNEEKVLDHELKVGKDATREDECFAWCNLLSARYARNGADSPLVKIRLFEVNYVLPPPGVDYRAWYNEQMRLTPDHLPTNPDQDEEWQTSADFYEYNPATRKGRRLQD